MNSIINNDVEMQSNDELHPLDKTETEIGYEEKTYARTIDKFSKFVLIGNNIDGIVEFSFCEFANFEEVKEKIPQILYELVAFGEWDLILYQVPENYIIKKRYGYYKYPNKGRKIYEHNYMDLPIKDIHFKDNTILFIGCKLSIEEDWSKDEVYFEKNLWIEVLKVKLNFK
jgi:hypothetical protein